MIPSAHRVDTWEEGYYSVKRIVNHRLLPYGTTEYEYEWKDKKLNGEPWPNSWSTADDLTPDLIQQYEERRGYGVPSKIVDVNCALVYEETRRTISHALMFAAPNASGFQGRNRPRVHDPVLVLMSIQTVALGVLDIARKDGGPTLEITTGKTSGQRWWQLIINRTGFETPPVFVESLGDVRGSVGDVRPRRLMNAVRRRMPIFTWLYLLAEWVREVLARVSARDLLPRDAGVRETGRYGAPFQLFGTSERQYARPVNNPS
jgi:hypothetical protein